MSEFDPINVAGIEQAYGLKDKFKTAQDINEWKVIGDSSTILSNENTYGLKAVVFQHAETGALHFAFAGTDPKNLWDLLDDARIFFGYVPLKFPAIQKLIEVVKQQIGVEEFVKLTISCSGHSLGGVLSELSLAEFASYGTKAKSTTFDNPGSANVIKYAIKDNNFTGKEEVQIEKIAEYADSYLARKNFINNMSYQLDNHPTLVLPQKQQEKEVAPTFWSKLWYNGKSLLNTYGGWIFDETAKKIDSYLESYLESINLKIKFETIFEYSKMLYKQFDNLIAEIATHSLKNFEKLELGKLFKLDANKVDGGLSVIDSSEASKFANIKPTEIAKSDLVIIDETDYEDEDSEDEEATILVSATGYTYNDINCYSTPATNIIGGEITYDSSEATAPAA